MWDVSMEGSHIGNKITYNNDRKRKYNFPLLERLNFSKSFEK
jgi:hypothetical protein